MDKNTNKKFIEANELVRKRKYNEAEKLFLEYIKEADIIFKKQSKKCYSFRSLEQFYLFIKVFRINDDVSWLNLYSDEAYRLLAYMKVEQKDYDKAEEYIKKSFKYNPVNINTFFELVEVYKMQNDLDKMKEELDNLYPYIIDSIQLARYYRNLGFYYTEKENYELAFALYIISTHYSFSNIALDEMIYIRNKMNNNEFMLEKKDAKKMLEDNNITLGIDKKNLQVLESLLKDKKILENKEYCKKIKVNYEKLISEIK